MEEWPTVRFGDVVQKMNGKIDLEERAGKLCVRGEHIPRICPTDVDHIVTNNDYLGPAFHRTFESNDVLFATRFPNLNKVGKPRFSGICANTTLVLRSNQNLMLQGFLPYLMKTTAFVEHCILFTRGSTNPYINWTQLADYEFRLPPIETQHRLIAVVEQWVDLFEKDSELKMNFSNTVDKYHNQELEIFGKKHQFSSLQDVTVKITVGVVIKPAAFYSETGTLALRNLNVVPMGMKLDKVKYFTKEGVAAHTKSILKEGDVVVTRSGTTGIATVIPKELAGSICIDMLIIRTDETLDPQYLAMVINSSYGKRQSGSATAGTAQQHYNVGNVKKMIIPIPPIDIQRNFVANSNVLLSNKEMVSKRIQSTESLLKPLVDNFGVIP